MNCLINSRFFGNRLKSVSNSAGFNAPESLPRNSLRGRYPGAFFFRNLSKGGQLLSDYFVLRKKTVQPFQYPCGILVKTLPDIKIGLCNLLLKIFYIIFFGCGLAG